MERLKNALYYSDKKGTFQVPWFLKWNWYCNIKIIYTIIKYRWIKINSKIDKFNSFMQAN